MDEKNNPSKRKSLEETNCSQSKTRKLQENAGTSSGNQNSLSDTLAFLWKAKFEASGLSNQGKEKLKLAEVQDKYNDLKKHAQNFQERWMQAEKTMTDVKVELKKEILEKQSLSNKISETFRIITSITKHFSSINESLEEMKEYNIDLTELFNNVIVKLSERNQTLNDDMKKLIENQKNNENEIQEELVERHQELTELKQKYKELESRLMEKNDEVLAILENNKAKLLQAEENEVAFQQLKEKLELELLEERNQKISNQEELEKVKIEFELKMEELMNDYEGKFKEMNSLIVQYQHDIEAKNQNLLDQSKLSEELTTSKMILEKYEYEIKELKNKLAEKLSAVEQLENNKVQMEQELQIKSLEYSQLIIDFDMLKEEKEGLVDKINSLMKKLEDEQAENAKLITENETKIQESKNDYNQLNILLQESKESLEKEVEELKKKLAATEKDLQVNSVKYNKCLKDFLTTSESLMEQKKISQTSARNIMDEQKKYEELLQEQKTLQLKLQKTENLLTQKTKMCEELGMKVAEVEKNYKSLSEKYEKLDAEKNSIETNKINRQNDDDEFDKKLTALEEAMAESPTISFKEKPKSTRNPRILSIVKIPEDKAIKSILKAPLVNSQKSPKTSPKRITFGDQPDCSQDRSSVVESQRKIDDLYDIMREEGTETKRSTRKAAAKKSTASTSTPSVSLRSIRRELDQRENDDEFDRIRNSLVSAKKSPAKSPVKSPNITPVSTPSKSSSNPTTPRKYRFFPSRGDKN